MKKLITIDYCIFLISCLKYFVLHLENYVCNAVTQIAPRVRPALRLGTATLFGPALLVFRPLYFRVPPVPQLQRSCRDCNFPVQWSHQREEIAALQRASWHVFGQPQLACSSATQLDFCSNGVY